MSSLAQPKTNGSIPAANPVTAPAFPAFLPPELFVSMLRLEQKRTERSHRRFVLMLLEASSLLNADESREMFNNVVAVLSRSTRETDIKGWHTDGSVIGIIFTEVGAADGKAVACALLNKVTNALSTTLNIEQINEVKVCFHVFPEQTNGGAADSTIYHDLPRNGDSKRTAKMMRRAIDIAGGSLALILAFAWSSRLIFQ